MSELKRVSAEREEELESRIMHFTRAKEELYQKAKSDAANEERKRTEKYLSKLERVKHQELVLAKHEQREALKGMKA